MLPLKPWLVLSLDYIAGTIESQIHVKLNDAFFA